MTAHSYWSVFDGDVVLYQILLQDAICSPPSRNILGGSRTNANATINCVLTSMVDIALDPLKVVVVLV